MIGCHSKFAVSASITKKEKKKKTRYMFDKLKTIVGRTAGAKGGQALPRLGHTRWEWEPSLLSEPHESSYDPNKQIL